MISVVCVGLIQTLCKGNKKRKTKQAQMSIHFERGANFKCLCILIASAGKYSSEYFVVQVLHKINI